jgi:manganese/iron transport system permease protein
MLVVAMLVTPGATAYLLTDRFSVMLRIGAALGAVTSFFGAYLSYFLDGATGGCIVSLQTLIFVAALLFAPKHGVFASRRTLRRARAQEAAAP